MRLILLITLPLLLCLTSCYEMFPQEVRINPVILVPAINTQRFAQIRVNVHDKRSDRYTIGKRGMLFGGKISNSQNLQIVVGKKMTEWLAESGFSFGSDRVINVFILSLDYKVRNYLLKSDTFTNCLLSVMVKDENGLLRYQNYYRGEAFSSRYLIAPRASTNEGNINLALGMAITKILNDKNLAQALQ